MRHEKRPTISVVIPTLGRQAALKNTLQDLSRQDYSEWECLVVIQGDLDARFKSEISEVLEKRVRIFYTDEPNASLARNIGLLEATGEIVLFLDDDVKIANPSFLARHVRHYRNPQVSGVAGQVLAPGMRPRIHRHWISRYRTSGWLAFPTNYSYPTKLLSAGSGNLSVRRKSAIDAGGMDAQYEKGAHREESDFCLRLCRKYGPLLFDPDASLIHLGEPTGGCRSWGHNSGIHPLHHVCGEWYFILNGRRLCTISFLDLPLHFFTLVRRQILNAENGGSPQRILRALRRSREGYRLARRKLRQGPRLVCDLVPSSYRCICHPTEISAVRDPLLGEQRMI